MDKEIFLKNGLSGTSSGEVLIDPRKVDMEFRLGYNDKFELADIFENMQFNNNNLAAVCLDLFYEIQQGNHIPLFYMKNPVLQKHVLKS